MGGKILANKYVVNVTLEKQRNAMSKAKSDVTDFASEIGYEPINLAQIDNKIKRVVLTNFIIKKAFGKLRKNDTLLVQFPTYMGKHFDDRLFVWLKTHGVKTIALIHDIDCLRFDDPKYPSLATVVNQLNNFDIVISSNKVMSKFLQNNGLNPVTISLDIFDYKHNATLQQKEFSETLNFAGNLDKSKFLQDLEGNGTIKYELFGKLTEKENLPSFTKYNGSFLPEQLPGEFKKGFGLVWDGESPHKVLGKIGLYQRYNNPHKVSLYLSAGLPVIIWNQAALAEFVLENKVGLVVNSLDSVADKIAQISLKEYNEMVANAEQLSKKLVTGTFTKEALKKAELL